MPSMLPSQDEKERMQSAAIGFVAKFFNPFGMRPIFTVILFILLVSVIRACFGFW